MSFHVLNRKSGKNIVVCHGKLHKRITFIGYHHVDVNKSSNPDTHGDLFEYILDQKNNSISEIVFAYCPTYIYNDQKMHKIYKKIKKGGKIYIYGPSINSFINVSKTIQPIIKNFGNIIKTGIKKSNQNISIIENETLPYIVLVNKKK